MRFYCFSFILLQKKTKAYTYQTHLSFKKNDTIKRNISNPLSGQSRNSSGSFGIQKWMSCWMARGHNKYHCNELIPAMFSIICSWHICRGLTKLPSWKEPIETQNCVTSVTNKQATLVSKEWFQWCYIFYRWLAPAWTWQRISSPSPTSSSS